MVVICVCWACEPKWSKWPSPCNWIVNWSSELPFLCSHALVLLLFTPNLSAISLLITPLLFQIEQYRQFTDIFWPPIILGTKIPLEETACIPLTIAEYFAMIHMNPVIRNNSSRNVKQRRWEGINSMRCANLKLAWRPFEACTKALQKSVSAADPSSSKVKLSLTIYAGIWERNEHA